MAECMGDDLANRADQPVVTLCEPVIHPETLSPRLNDAGAAQVGEVTRRLGLRDREALVNVAHTDFTRQQQTEDPQSRLVGQRLENAFHRGELLVHICALTNIARLA